MKQPKPMLPYFYPIGMIASGEMYGDQHNLCYGALVAHYLADEENGPIDPSRHIKFKPRGNDETVL